MRSLCFAILVVLCLGVAGYAIGVYASLPLGAVVHPDLRPSFEAHRTGVYVHVFAASLALILGPFQFLGRLRSARPRLHRWMGRCYLGVGVLVGGLAGMGLALHAAGGEASRMGFASLALVWLYTGFRAYGAIRGGDVRAHQQWMVRNFALSFAAVTLRLWIPAAMLAGAPFEVAYPVVAWLCWIPNLLVAEWLIRRGDEADKARA